MASWQNLPPAGAMRSGGHTLHGRRLGEGPRLLILHGGPGLDHHVMLPLAVPLADDHEVILPDLPGHGRSSSQNGSLPDLAQVVEYTARWIDGLGTRPEVAVGHSLGGWVLVELMRRRRLVPRAAVLLAPAVGAMDRVSPPPRVAPKRVNEAALREELLAFATHDVEGVRPTPEFVASVRLALLRPPAAYAALHGQLQRALSGPPPRARMDSPLLILGGTEDRVCPAHRVARLAEATEGSTLEMLEGAGHMPFAIHAEPIVRRIRSFLAPRRPDARG